MHYLKTLRVSVFSILLASVCLLQTASFSQTTTTPPTQYYKLGKTAAEIDAILETLIYTESTGPQIDNAVGRAIDVSSFGASSSSSASVNVAAIQAAFTSAVTGSVIQFAPGVVYSINDTIRVATPVTIQGNGAVLSQSTANKTALRIMANGVTVDGIEFRGVLTDSHTDASAINACGTLASPISGTTVRNVKINNFGYGIWADYNRNFVATYDTISHVRVGIAGGCASAADGNALDVSYDISHVRVYADSCTPNFARPFYFRFARIVKVKDCRGRAGGMGCESFFPFSNWDGVRPFKTVISDNDFDTGISCGPADVSRNILDLSQAPVGRGLQDGWNAAIEMDKGICSFNRISHQANGIANNSFELQIIGNRFDSCGYTIGSHVGATCILMVGATYPDSTIKSMIANNWFFNSGGDEIQINYLISPRPKYQAILISDNQSYKAKGAFLTATDTRGCSVRGNMVVNAWSGGSASYCNGVNENGHCANVYEGNTFLNLESGTGMNYGVSASYSSVFGLNTFFGMRGGGISTTNANAIVSPLIVNGLHVQHPSGSASTQAGTFEVADVLYSSSPAIGSPDVWICTVAGTNGTLSGVTGSTIGGNIKASNIANIFDGMYVTIVGHSGKVKILEVRVADSVLVLSSTVGESLTGAALAYSPPTFKSLGGTFVGAVTTTSALNGTLFRGINPSAQLVINSYVDGSGNGVLSVNNAAGTPQVTIYGADGHVLSLGILGGTALKLTALPDSTTAVGLGSGTVFHGTAGKMGIIP